MGKRIRAQRRGSSPKNRVNSHRFPGANRLPRKDGEIGEVVDMIHSPVHTGPLAKLKFEDGTTGHVAATEGMFRYLKWVAMALYGLSMGGNESCSFQGAFGTPPRVQNGHQN